jgi:hypothetical protein
MRAAAIDAGSLDSEAWKGCALPRTVSKARRVRVLSLWCQLRHARKMSRSTVEIENEVHSNHVRCACQ